MMTIIRASALFALFFLCQHILYASDKSIDIDELNKKANSYIKKAEYDSAIFYYQKSALHSPTQKDYFDKLLKISSIYRIERKHDSVQAYINKLEIYVEELKQNHRTEFFEFHAKSYNLRELQSMKLLLQQVLL